ncbi:MAG: IS3 family transposase [Jatrophihabitantaceae bacterium]
MPERRMKYSPEFKEEAVKVVIESSRSTAEVAREIGVNEGTLGNWVAKYRSEHVDDEPSLTLPERARLRELEREVRELRMKSEFLGKSGGLLRRGVSVMSKYEFIDAQKAFYPIVLMCLWAGVSRSGFYHWCSRPVSASSARRRELEVLVARIFADSDGTYGYRRVHAELARGQVVCGPELVRDVMRDLELYPCQPKPFRPITTIAGDAAAVPDLVARDFSAGAPGTKLVGDITYIPTWRGWAYLATVIDCHTKACIGWAIADHMRADLVCQALDMAARNYDLAAKCIFHSDRGTQYMSDQFAKHATKLDLRRSVGRTGICYDNALAESFNAAVKVERVNRTQYPTLEHAQRDIARYIEFRYNRRRLHSALGYRTPLEAYNDYTNNQSLQSAA